MASRYIESSLVGIYLKEIYNFRILSAEEELDSFKKILLLNSKIKETTNEKEKNKLKIELKIKKDQIFNSNVRFVVNIAKKYINRGLPLLDLIQEGNIGLLTAIEKFDLSFNCKLTTYADWWIRQAIKKALACKSRSIRLPIVVHNRLFNLNYIKKILEENLGREISLKEFSEFGGINSSKIKHLFNVSNVLSLNATIGEEDDTCLIDFVTNNGANFEDNIINKIYSDQLNKIIENELDERRQKIIKMRYGYPEYGKIYTLKEVSKEIGTTLQNVRQLQEGAIIKLRNCDKIKELSY